MTELRDDRYFGFTKYVKMDDSYLEPCYEILMARNGSYVDTKATAVDHITPEMLRFMKNEIYADYAYQFKDKRWNAVFANMQQYSPPGSNGDRISHANVDDSLTEIDKYNINWIAQKLKGVKTPLTTLAAK